LEEPTCPEEINLNWIEQVFDKAHIFQKPISFNIDKYFKTQSLLGDIIRIELNYPIDCNSPKTIIVKFQKCTDKEREGNVYKLLKDRKIKSIPKVLHICSTGTIVLEDLSKYSTGSMVNGCTFEQIKQIISIIVQVHSEYWNKNVGPEFNYKNLHWFLTIICSRAGSNLKVAIEKLWVQPRKILNGYGKTLKLFQNCIVREIQH
jgi:hypothetical protein